MTAADDLWVVYAGLAARSQQLWRQWDMQRAVARTDGTAGLLYGQAYEAQQLTDKAYEAWLAVAYPPPVSGP